MELCSSCKCVSTVRCSTHCHLFAVLQISANQLTNIQFKCDISMCETYMSLSSDSLIESTTHCSNSFRNFDLIDKKKDHRFERGGLQDEIKRLEQTLVLWKESLAGSSVCNPPTSMSGLLTLGHTQLEQW